MSDPKQPPGESEDDERWEDDGGAVDGQPQEPKRSGKTETTEKGLEVPVPTRNEFFQNLKRASDSE